jgi:hypothetical protein
MKMKKFVTAVFLLFAVITTYSQSFHAGIKLGANINKLDGEPFSNEFTYGYHVGAFAEIGLGDKFSVEPEVLFNQVNVDTAQKFSSVFGFNNVSNIQLKYLSIPILAEYKLGKMIALQAGPQFGILIDQTGNLVQNGKNAFNKGDFSLVGGIQVKLLGLRIYGRYVAGLNNINDTNNPGNWKSETIQLGIGYSFL